MDRLTMQDGAPGDAVRAEAMVRPADPDLMRLFDELRGLLWAFPIHPAPPEADEADFDNMPV